MDQNISIKSTKIKKRLQKNLKFKRRFQWYQLGQRRCHCCGVQMTWENGNISDKHRTKRTATVEHLVPASKGGTMDTINILVTCWGCNNDRGNEDWIDFVQTNKFPKGEWLIARYLMAVEFYKNGGNRNKSKDGSHIHPSIYKNADNYAAKLAA